MTKTSVLDRRPSKTLADKNIEFIKKKKKIEILDFRRIWLYCNS